MPNLSKADQAAKVSANEARRRKEVALAELREYEAAEKRGELVRADAVREAWLKILMAVRSGVLRIPDKCAPAVAVAAGDPREVRAILARECEDVLRGLHDDVKRVAE